MSQESKKSQQGSCCASSRKTAEAVAPPVKQPEPSKSSQGKASPSPTGKAAEHGCH